MNPTPDPLDFVRSMNPTGSASDALVDEIRQRPLMISGQEVDALIARIDAEKAARAELRAEFSANVDHLDLMVDEFGRIRALMMGGHPHLEEVQALCERAISQTTQRVPVIKQRNDVIRMLNEATARADVLHRLLNNFLAAADSPDPDGMWSSAEAEARAYLKRTNPHNTAYREVPEKGPSDG